MRTIEQNSTNYLKIFQLSILWHLRDNRRYLYLAIPFTKKRLLVTPSSMKFQKFHFPRNYTKIPRNTDGVWCSVHRYSSSSGNCKHRLNVLARTDEGNIGGTFLHYNCIGGMHLADSNRLPINGPRVLNFIVDFRIDRTLITANSPRCLPH